MKHLPQRYVIALVAVFATPLALSAQSFESLIKNVTDVDFFFTCWNTPDVLQAKASCLGGRNGYGVEVSYEVGKINLFGISTKEPGKGKLVGTEEVVRDGRRQILSVYEPTDSTVELSSYMLVEIGLGYSQFTGFKSNDTRFDLVGAVREIPAVSLYGTYSSDDTTSFVRKVQPYVGLRSGLIQLQDVQAYVAKDDSVRSFAGTGQSFQFGFVAGVAFQPIDKISFFVEGAWLVRNFESVKWSTTNGYIPKILPESLDFSGRSVTFGIQVKIK